MEVSSYLVLSRKRPAQARRSLMFFSALLLASYRIVSHNICEKAWVLVLCDLPYNRHCVSNLYVVRFNVQIIAGVLTSGWSRSASLHKTVHGADFKLNSTPRVVNVLNSFDEFSKMLLTKMTEHTAFLISLIGLKRAISRQTFKEHTVFEE